MGNDFLAKLVIVLKEEQGAFARAALERPKESAAFAYGVACGHYEGLQHAVDTIESFMADEEEHERKS